MLNKKRVIHNILLIAASLFMAVSFYVICGVNSDDAATYVWLREHFDLGEVHHSLKEYLNPWFLVAVILYKAGIGNNGAELVAYCYSIWIFLCSFLTLKIALRNCVQGEGKNSWLLFLAVFMMMPSTSINRYHLPAIFAALLLLWAVDIFLAEHRIWALILSVVYVLYTMMLTADKMLVLLEIAAPVGLYGVIWCIQKRERHKFLLAGLGIVAVAAACARVVSDLFLHPVTEPWGGYGGADYMYWTNVHTFLDKGIPSFFAALLNQYNIRIGGGLIQFLSLYWVIRIIIVGIILAAFIFRCRDIAVKGIENVNLVDVFSVLAAAALVGVNILNGIAEVYSLNDQPINRYAGLAWYLLLIVFIRWVNEHYESLDVMTIKNRRISSGFALGMIFLFLIAGYSKPVYKGRDALVGESCQAQVDFLKQYGDQYRYGLASLWKSHPITAITNGKYVICPGWITEEEVDHDIKYLNCSGNQSDWNDGSNYFNIILSYLSNETTMGEENIEALRGDYIDKIAIGDTVYYLYDYDIRWDSRLIMESVGTDYELTEPIQYYFDFPVGSNRIVMDVANSDNLELSIEGNEDVSDVSIQKLSDNKVYVDLVCTQNTNVIFHVARQADELTTIHKIVLKRVRAAIGVESDEIYLKPGDYIVTFNGSNLHDLQVSFEGENVTVSRLTDGRIKNRYQVHVDKAQTVKYSILGKDASIDSVYYENAVLFEDES